MNRSRRHLEAIELAYWAKHPRDLATRELPRRRLRDWCRKWASIWLQCFGDLLIGLCVTCVSVCCCTPNCCGEISPVGTPSTPSPPPTPRMNPREVLSMAPIPLRGQPRRDLTLFAVQAASRGDNAGHSMGNQQFSSPLMRLPREVRHMIWDLILTGHVFHIGWSPKRLHHTECSRCSYSDFYDNSRDSCWPFSLEPSLHQFRRKAQDHATPSSNALGITKSCKLLYAETIHLIYATNVFSFNSYKCIDWFLRSILPQRVQAIRRIRLRWDLGYEPVNSGTSQSSFTSSGTPAHVCQRLNSMQNLNELLVRIVGSIYGPQNQTDYLLAYFRMIERVETFRIVGPFGGVHTSEQDQAASYHLYSSRSPKHRYSLNHPTHEHSASSTSHAGNASNLASYL